MPAQLIYPDEYRWSRITKVIWWIEDKLRKLDIIVNGIRVSSQLRDIKQQDIQRGKNAEKMSCLH